MSRSNVSKDYNNATYYMKSILHFFYSPIFNFSNSPGLPHPTLSLICISVVINLYFLSYGSRSWKNGWIGVGM